MTELDVIKSLRLSEELLRAARYRARTEHVDEASALRHMIALGAEEYACQLYREGEVTLRQAAALADLTYREMLERLWDRGIKGNLTAEDERESIRTLRELLGKGKSTEKGLVARDRGTDDYTPTGVKMKRRRSRRKD